MRHRPRTNGPISWEPEPLHIPVEPPSDRNRSSEEGQPEPEEQDLPGSHVIVIDLG